VSPDAPAAPARTRTRVKKTAEEPVYSRAEMKRLLEAILFASDKPVPAATLAQILSNSPEESVRDALAEMSREYEETGRSFQLKEIGGGHMLFTHPAYEPWVRKLFRGRLTLRLSRSALETVAIVAYRQPVTKQEIETIRGVNADGVLNTLLDRKLIRVMGRKEGMGRALLYGTTNEFLMYMGINDLSDLPQLEEMKAILEAREAPATEAAAAGPFASVAAQPPVEAQQGGEISPAGDAQPATVAEPSTGEAGAKSDPVPAGVGGEKDPVADPETEEKDGEDDEEDDDDDEEEDDEKS